jgi:hypothetical protein
LHDRADLRDTDQKADDVTPTTDRSVKLTSTTEQTVTVSTTTGAAGRDTRRVQKLLAASLWTAVGIGLSAAGVFWMFGGFGALWATLLAVPMIALGFVKGRFILDKMAKKAVVRIADRGPDAPWWGFYPLRTWVLIAVMMGSGILLRTAIPAIFYGGHAPAIYFAYVGLLYLAVGVALIHASRTWWAAFFSHEA